MSAKRKTAEERFWPKVDASGDCWEWTATRTKLGYGMFALYINPADTQTTGVCAHRFAYESLVGPIPEGLVLDHLCRNPGCVNPDHLQPVTQAENHRRGIRWTPQKLNRTTCKHGHTFEGDNVGRHKDGARYCRTCSRVRTRLRDQRYGNSPAQRAARRAA